MSSTSRAEKPRTQTDQPHFLLSTLPFLVLLGALALLAALIFVAAFPGSQPQPKYIRTVALKCQGHRESGPPRLHRVSTALPLYQQPIGVSRRGG